jgi:16S rRNA (guanine527-N7)-methyltransferase
MAVPRRIDGPEAFASTFGVSRETLEKLNIYERLLKQWQGTINLVAPSTLDDIWHRHFADSAQLWPLAKGKSGLWLDLGSGAGFPGLILAILAANAGESRHTLIESDSRKAAFLRQVARETGTLVDILCTRIENAETHAKVKDVNVMTARALAPLPRLAELVAPYFGPSTTGLFLKGREVSAEIGEAAQNWQFDYDLQPSLTDDAARVLLLKALKYKT